MTPLDDPFARFVEDTPEAQRELTETSGHAIRAIFPDATVRCDASNAAFGFSARIADTVFVVTPQKAYVNLGFAFGVGLPDPDGLLQGTGKRHRHVRFRSPEDLASPALKALMKAAMAAAVARRR